MTASSSDVFLPFPNNMSLQPITPATYIEKETLRKQRKRKKKKTIKRKRRPSILPLNVQ
jgi:hypothetical protein